MLIGAISFCGFMVICLQNMRVFQMSVKKELLIIMVLIMVIIISSQFSLSAFIYLPVVLLLLWITYRSLLRSVMFLVYSSSLLLGFRSAINLAFTLLGISEGGWTVYLFNISYDIWQIIGLVVVAGFVGLFIPLRKLLEKRIDMNIFNSRIMYFMLICASVVLAFIYVGYATPDTYISLGQWVISFEDIAHVLFFLFSVTMFLVILWYLSRETAIKTEKLLIEASNKYIHDLEESYKTLRTIKHDYVNILSSFKLYIDSKDMDGLEKYYYDEFSEMNNDLLHQDKLIGSLQNVQLNEIKSVLIYKGSIAARHGVNISVEVRESIESIGVSTAIVCQIIGILMDNAIEAAEGADERKINIAVIKNPNSKAFIIKNTWKEQDIPMNKLFELGFSTKGENRGTGLHTVRNYTDRIKGLHLETEITDEYFCQILTVKDV